MRKKLLAIVATLAMVLTMIPATAFAAGSADYGWYGDGSATEYTLNSAADLQGFANIVNGTDEKTAADFAGKTVKLGADIDLTGVDWTPIGGLDASKDFKGAFDGNDKTISNLTMNLGDKGDAKVRAGLFASLTGSVSDLTLKNVKITVNGTNVRAGALGGNIWDDAIVSNVTVDGFTFNGSGDITVGGLSGQCYESGNIGASGTFLKDITVKNVNITASGIIDAGGVNGYHGGYFNATNVDAENITITATVTGMNGSSTDPRENGIGGFFGADAVGGAYDFKNCDVKNVNITVKGSEKTAAGGFGGFAAGGGCWAKPNIDTCTTQGTITNENTSDVKLGGFYGRAIGGARTFDACVANVDIVSSVGVSGGFVGEANETWYDLQQTYTNCKVEGDVSGNIAGGFFGNVSRADVTGCEANGEVKGTIAGGFIGAIAAGNNKGGSEIIIKESVASGKVHGEEVTGGIVGDNPNDGNKEVVIDCSVPADQPVTPGEADTPAKGDTAAKPDKADATAATGDDMNMVLPIAVAGLALAAMAAVVATRRKHD